MKDVIDDCNTPNLNEFEKTLTPEQKEMLPEVVMDITAVSFVAAMDSVNQVLEEAVKNAVLLLPEGPRRDGVLAGLQMIQFAIENMRGASTGDEARQEMRASIDESLKSRSDT